MILIHSKWCLKKFRKYFIFIKNCSMLYREIEKYILYEKC
jgi:hypothetical protein